VARRLSLAGAVAVAAIAIGALATSGAAQGPGDASVLVVGDSLGEGTAPYLKQQLPGTPIHSEVQTSETSAAGLEVLRSAISTSDAVVVFALGTNDDPSAQSTYADTLAQAAAIAGGRCLIVPTIVRPPVGGVSYDGLNNTIRHLAATNFNVEVVDWAREISANPKLLVDGVHVTADGYAFRAQLIAQAVDSCLLSTPTPSSDGDGRSSPPDLSEGNTRPPQSDAQATAAAEGAPVKPISTDKAYKILADVVSSEIAIGALP
jgi:lysophospholipase L1-like esterase